MSALRIHWRLVLGVLVLQTLLGLAEAANVLACHIGGGECWAWFFIFTFNLPLSIPVMELIGSIPYSDSFYPVWALSFVLFVLAGTVQWAFLFHVIVWVFAPLKRALGRTNA